MNDGNTFPLGIANMSRLQRLSGEDDFALVTSVRIDTAQHFHQRGFSRAIFTTQRDDFAGIQAQAYIVDGFHRAKSFGDAFHFQ
ncbi:hypothetical protein D3C86_1654910 [compost metagenome]